MKSLVFLQLEQRESQPSDDAMAPSTLLPLHTLTSSRMQRCPHIVPGLKHQASPPAIAASIPATNAPPATWQLGEGVTLHFRCIIPKLLIEPSTTVTHVGMVCVKTQLLPTRALSVLGP